MFNALLAVRCFKTFPLDANKLIHHLCQMQTNVYAIWELITEDSTRGTQKVTQERIAEAIYATSSLLNHSCIPNTSLEYKGRTLIIRYKAKFSHSTPRASEGISKGEQIYNCYGPHYARMETRRRKEVLKKQYLFDCQCTACSQ